MRRATSILVIWIATAGCNADPQAPIERPTPPATSPRPDGAPRFRLGEGRNGGQPCCGIYEVAGGDFDGDGTFDMAVLHGHYHFSSSPKNLDVDMVYGLNPGTRWASFFIDGGASIAEDSLRATSGRGLMAALDLDGQGGVDLVGIDRMKLRWLRSAGPRTPSTVDDLATLDVMPTRLLAGDIAGDGRPDLVIEYLDASKALRTRVHAGPGPGGIGDAVGDIASGLGVLPLLADITGGGRVELAAVEGALAVTRAFHDPDGFGPARTAPFDLNGRGHATALVAGDLDHDGRADLIVGESLDVGLGGGRVVVLRGDGTGGLARGIATPVRTAPLHLATADFDGDGLLDVAAALDEPPYDFAVLLGDGTGGFSAALTFAGTPVEALLAADADKDGTPDLITARRGGADQPDAIVWFRGMR